MNKNAAVNELLGQYLNRGISRRSFIQALGAVGISSAGISSMLEVAQAVERGVIPNNAHLFTGTGGELMVEQLKAAGVKLLFTNPGTSEVGFFDACLDEPIQLILCLHEGIVVSAADGYAKVSREPGFINVHAFATAQAAGCDGIRVEQESDLRPALRRGIEATRAGVPFLIDVEVARIGAGAVSAWFQEFSVARSREKE